MPLKVICAGYHDTQGQIVPCGKHLGEYADAQDGVSHGLCEACYQKQLELLQEQEWYCLRCQRRYTHRVAVALLGTCNRAYPPPSTAYCGGMLSRVRVK